MRWLPLWTRHQAPPLQRLPPTQRPTSRSYTGISTWQHSPSFVGLYPSSRVPDRPSRRGSFGSFPVVPPAAPHLPHVHACPFCEPKHREFVTREGGRSRAPSDATLLNIDHTDGPNLVWQRDRLR